MKILRAPNPLRTIVELDDADRWALRETIVEFCDDEDSVYVNDVYDSYVQALHGAHEGDCTCVPCGCSKCGAENCLGINTMPGLTKHLANKVDAAFREYADRSLEDVIEALANYSPIPASPMWDDKLALWEAYLPRWRDEARQARAWLIAYRDRYFPRGG